MRIPEPFRPIARPLGIAWGALLIAALSGWWRRYDFALDEPVEFPISVAYGAPSRTDPRWERLKSAGDSALSAALRAVDSGVPKRRFAGMSLLASIRGPRATSALIRLLSDREVGIRNVAASALSVSASREDAPAILQAMEAADIDLRQRLFWTMRGLRTPETADAAILVAGSSPGVNVVRDAIQAVREQAPGRLAEVERAARGNLSPGIQKEFGGAR